MGLFCELLASCGTVFVVALVEMSIKSSERIVIFRRGFYERRVSFVYAIPNLNVNPPVIPETERPYQSIRS